MFSAGAFFFFFDTAKRIYTGVRCRIDAIQLQVADDGPLYDLSGQVGIAL